MSDDEKDKYMKQKTNSIQAYFTGISPELERSHPNGDTPSTLTFIHKYIINKEIVQAYFMGIYLARKLKSRTKVTLFPP